MNRDLFLALLSLDSYNREYGAGINVTGSSLGNAFIISSQSLGVDSENYRVTVTVYLTPKFR